MLIKITWRVQSSVTIILLIHQKIFSEARSSLTTSLGIIPWKLILHKENGKLNMCSDAKEKFAEPGHKASIHTVQSSKESKKGNYWSGFLFFFFFFNFLFLRAVLFMWICVLLKSLQALLLHRKELQWLVGGRGWCRESGPQGRARRPAAGQGDQCTRHRACRQAVTKSDSSYMAQEWNILRRFYLKGTRNASLRWRWEEGLRKSTHRLGYQALESKLATTAARHGVGALTCMWAKRNSLYGHKWKCQANHSGTAGPL